MRRFGRFPNRSPVLGPTATVEEAVFLQNGGSNG
ncbi:DUF924 family protein [Ochrobactrum teleogrylli]